MCNLPDNYYSNIRLMFDDEWLDKIVYYLSTHKNNEPFTLKQTDKDELYFLKHNADDTYNLISCYMTKPIEMSENDKNGSGYVRYQLCYGDEIKHRLIYRMFGCIPDNVDFDKMEIHHKNGNKLDNRLNNLYLISPENHRILHKLIDKYGIDNVEL